MFDDDDDRLLIDDHEQSGECGPEKEKVSSNDERISFTPPDSELQLNFPASNGISVLSGLNSSKEEGELDDEEMDTSFSRTPAKNIDFKPSTPVDRKRSNGEQTPKHSTTVSPKKAKLSKHEKRDQGTSVNTKAIQADSDESPFDMESGSSFVIQLTVVCKPSEGTLLVTGKWKDLELTGTISDGEPPGFHNFAKKRNALMSNNSSGESDKSNVGTPSKKRLGRGNESSKKKSQNKADDDEDELDVTGTEPRDGNSSGGSFKLMEVPPRSSMHTCPHEGCEHRYELSTEMEYHIGTVHKKKAVMYENNSCQTTPDAVEKKVMVSVCTDTEGLCAEVKMEKIEDPVPPPSEALLAVAKVEGVVKSPSSHLSDISDDAPQLQKEEPHHVELNNGVTSRPSTSTPAAAARQPTPSTPADRTTTPAAIVQPSAVVPPVAASPRAAQSNGLLMPAAHSFISPFTPFAGTSSVTTPNREPNKLNQLKDAAGVAETVSSTHTPAKPIASPAQNRTAFAVPPMAHPHPAVSAGQSPMQAQQQMMQQQMLQQLMLQQMGQMGMRPAFPMPASAQEQMNQIAAIQAMQNGGFMFPKH